METGTEMERGRLVEALASRSAPFAAQPQQINPTAWNPNFAAVSGPTLYSHQAQSISCSALAQLADIQQQQQQQQQGGGGGGDRMSRSLTCLGLAGTIPEGTEGEEDVEQPAPQIQQSHHAASRSATDLASMGFGPGEDDVFGGMGSFELDGAGAPGAANRVSPFKVSANPSRTIIVGNVPSAAADEHLKALFQAYGDIQSLKTEYKAHGVVVVSFFDLRAALQAKRQLEGVTLSDQPLTIHFSASGTMLGNFGEATLLIFNVDPQAESQKLANTFSAFGDVRRIQEVPDKKNQKLIEFYDIRHANEAMAAVNKAIVSTSRPEGTGMRPVVSFADLGSHAQKESTKSDGTPSSFDDTSNLSAAMKAQISAAHAQNGNRTEMATDGSPTAKHGGDANGQGGMPRMVKSTSTGSGLADLAMLATQHNRTSTSPSALASGIAGGALPLTAQLAKGLQISDSASSLGNRGIVQGAGLVQPQQGILPSGMDAQFASLSLAQQAGLMGYSQTGVQPLTRETFGLNPAIGHDGSDVQGLRGPPPGFGVTGMPGLGFGRLASSISVGSGLDTMGQRQSTWGSGLSGLQQSNMLGTGVSNSAADLNLLGMNPQVSPEILNMSQNLWGPTGGLYQPQGNSMLPTQQNANIYETLAKLQQAGVAHLPTLLAQVNAGAPAGNVQGNFWNQHTMPNNTTPLAQAIGAGALPSLVSSGLPATQELGSMPKSSSSPALSLAADENREHRDAPKSGGRLSRRNVDPVLEAERKTQQQRLYALDLEKVKNGEDTRTTLMIKNIPNKYTQKMLLASVDEVLKGKFDFFYLPIDFKNKCNVGYGFINVMDSRHIPPLMERFHNKKWERFNSEKVCCVTYARIQGKSALINHFQNSSLMHEDKKHRPVLFYSDGPQFGEAEPFPVGPNVRPRITFKDRDFRSRERSGFWS